MSDTTRNTVKRQQRSPESPDIARVVLLTVTIVSTVGVMLIAFHLREILAVIALGIVVAVTCAPIADYFARWRIPRALVVLAIYTVIATIVGLFLWYAVPEVIGETNRLFDDTDEFEQRYAEIADDYNLPALSEVKEYAGPFVQSLAPTAARQALVLATGLVYVATIFVVALLFTTVKEQANDLLLQLVPARHRHRTDEVSQILGRRIRGVVVGDLMSMSIVGVVTYIGLVILGVPFPFLLASLAFLLELLPVLGPWLAAIPAVALALTVSPELAIAVAVFYLVLQQVESNIVLPLIQGRQTEMPAILVLSAVLLGGAAMGILGAVVALPVAVVVHTLVVEVLLPWRRAEVAEQDGFAEELAPPVVRELAGGGTGQAN